MPLLVNKIFSLWAPCVLWSIDNVHHIGQWICNSQFIILSVTIVLTRFRLACHGRDSTTSYLPVTVFVQDINDNPPVFQSQGERIGVFDRAMQFDIDTSPSTYSYMHKSGRKAKSSKNEHLNRHRYAPACWGVLLWRPVSPVDIRSQLETFCSVAPPPVTAFIQPCITHTHSSLECTSTIQSYAIQMTVRMLNYSLDMLLC